METERSSSCASLLTHDELLQAQRYHFERDRQRFIAARATLRQIMAMYLKVQPQTIVFRFGQANKPYLGGFHINCPLQFNVSHSHDLGLFAVALDREVGVDVEWIRRDRAILEIARSFFSPTEQAVLERVPRAMQASLFFRYWTRKEAFLKARGDGLTLDLDRFDVVDSQGFALRLRTHWDPSEAARWMLQDLPPCDGYAVALAAAGHDWVTRCWEWEG